MKHPIPTNLIFGFLGSGKSTAIKTMLAKKPTDETWAVLVNEFGEVGIDGELLSGQGAFIKEVPGGCMCCVAGLPMQMGLNMLIKQANPDRLLIEPTGLGHPHRILETLQSEFYQDVLELRTCITLVDPRRLQEPKVLENENFRAQVAVADILIGNKADACSEQEKSEFLGWAATLQHSEVPVSLTQLGEFPLEWLDGLHEQATPPKARGHQHRGSQEVRQWQEIEEDGWQQALNDGEGFFSCGWRIAPSTTFDYTALMSLAHNSQWGRLKGFLHTSDGWFVINAVDDVVTTQEVPEQTETRLEIISDEPIDSQTVDQLLRDCVSE